ncbi:MAG: ligand-binding sensor domain-containing protein/signal transduction histidine kinase, partial [Phenylobacterium sp.]
MSNVSPSSLFSGLWLRFSLLTVLLSTVFFHSSSPASPLIDPGPVVQQIEVIGGQPLGSIFQLIQGRSGFIWLATDNGLVRFDGYTVKRFVHDEAAANSISSNFVRDLLQDSQGFIWLITDDNGLNRFSPKTEQFVRFNSIKDDPTTLDSDMLNTISLSSDKQLWIGSSKGINRFDPQTLTNSRLNSQFFADGSSGNNISVLFEDKQQRLWYSVVNKGLHRFDLTTGVHQHFRHDPAKALSLATDWVRVVYERGDGTILVGTAAGLDRFESDTQQFHSINIPIAPSNRKKYLLITTLNEDSFGGLWIGSHFNGVSLLMPGADTAINMNSGLNGKDTFNGVFINDLLQDSSGTLWAATTENGLIRARAVNLLFEHSIVPYGSPLELTTLYADDQDQIWLGTSENLYQFNPSSKRFEMAAQAVGYIKDIVRDSSHSLIVTVADKGVYHFNTQTRQVSRYWQTSGAASDLPAGVISGLAIDQQGTSWIGFSGLNDDEGLNSADISGLFSLSSNSSSNRASQQKPHFTHHLDDFDVDSILPVNTAGGIKIVFGSHEHGLRVLDKSSGEVSNISALNRSEQQDFSHIIAIFADRQQRVWVSIKLLGLAQLDLQTGQLTLVLQGLGAGHSIIRSMVQDADGLMWLGTYGGLIQFNPDNHSYTALEHGQGLRLGKVSEDMAVVMPSGDVMVGHDTGLVRFSPSRLIASEQQSAANFPILLSDFRLFDQPIGLDDTDSPLSATINETTEFTIAYHQSRFSFLFASSDYQSPSTTRYRYRMARAGDNSAHWNDTDANNRLAAFTLLPAGQYVFSVKASNANGSWSDNIRHLNINITPPFWATTIAYVMYVLLAVFAGAMFNYMRVRKLQQRSELLEKRIEQRTVALQQRNDTISRLLQDKDRLFANISHEFRTPLTLILGPLESSLNTDKIDKIHSLMTLAKGNAQRLLSMVDQLLDISRLQEVQEMKTQAKDVLATCQFLLESYRSLADSKNVELLLDAPTGKTFSVDMLPDALEKILSNLLTNAFKYSDGRQVITLTVSKTSTTKGLVGLAGLDKVTIALSDTGMGISDADQLNIFERFTRVEVATDYIPGVGIG